MWSSNSEVHLVGYMECSINKGDSLTREVLFSGILNEVKIELAHITLLSNRYLLREGQRLWNQKEERERESLAKSSEIILKGLAGNSVHSSCNCCLSQRWAVTTHYCHHGMPLAPVTSAALAITDSGEEAFCIVFAFWPIPLLLNPLYPPPSTHPPTHPPTPPTTSTTTTTAVVPVSLFTHFHSGCFQSVIVFGTLPWLPINSLSLPLSSHTVVYYSLSPRIFDRLEALKLPGLYMYICKRNSTAL